ncbi:MAG TPA: FkbM family methyltransferase, partial [Nitrospira sp.]|nr:FkbM family methyltransferase [Nitrospira sp.]
YIHGQWTRRLGAQLTPGGRDFPYIPEDFHQWGEQAGRWASETRDYWLRFYEPKEGDTIIDVGAGQGEDTLTFSRAVGASGRVIAIEAHPLSFKALKTFCRRNHLHNVTPVNVALMDRPGEVHIVESESWMENRVETSNGSSGLSVRSATLDDLCRKEGIEDISFLKVNIEGAERYALLGAEKTMPRIRHLCVACHDFRANQGHGEYFRTRAFVEHFLVKHGFELVSRPDDPRDYVRDHLHGSRPR